MTGKAPVSRSADNSRIRTSRTRKPSVTEPVLFQNSADSYQNTSLRVWNCLLYTSEGDFLAGSERSRNRNLCLPAVLRRSADIPMLAKLPKNRCCGWVESEHAPQPHSVARRTQSAHHRADVGQNKGWKNAQRQSALHLSLIHI